MEVALPFLAPRVQADAARVLDLVGVWILVELALLIGAGEGAEGPQEEGAMPNADDLHNHLKSLFDGKIGTLAKELAEEMSGEVMDLFDDGEVKETNDVLKKMMRNPKKIMDLVKKIGSKLDDKMKAGSISQEELMKEGKFPLTPAQLKVQQKANEFKADMDSIYVVPFSNESWSQK